jgi:hypothetical protein
MSEALAECVFNVPHVVCGVALHPLSIWHVWLLEFVRSPYVGASSADEGRAGDLALALLICSRPASFPGETEESGVVFQVDPMLLERIEREGILESSLAFQNYFRDHVALPRCWESGEGRSVKSPICLYMAAVLMRHGRMNYAEAWATPFGYARHLVLALAEAGGNEIPLLSASEERALKEAGHQL